MAGAGEPLPVPTHARNMRIVGHTGQDGRGDGQQVELHRGHAYIGHIASGGFTIVDVRDATRPRTVGFVASPPNTWSLHLQAQDDLLLVVHGRSMFSRPAMAKDERNYYQPEAGRHDADLERTGRDWSAGMAIYDISQPASPRRIGFMPVEGAGLHRIWYAGGRWAYASAMLDGFSDFILVTIDMQDPARPEIVGRYWLPGMNLAGGEAPDWPLPRGRYGLHNAVVHDDVAYCAWRDANLVVVDVKDKAAPKLIARKSWTPPFGGGTHNCLPLPGRDLIVVLDEAVLDGMADGIKPIWVFDNRERTNPVSIATLPPPAERDYVAVGGHFGPHNIYHNRPNGFQSETLICSTWQNAGLRVHDISNPWQPVEVGACVPPAPKKLTDPRPNRPVVLHSADVFVDREGLCYVSDWGGGGLHIIEFTGAHA